MGLSKGNLKSIIDKISCAVPEFFLVGGAARGIYQDNYEDISDVDIATDIPLETLYKKLRPSFFKGREVKTLEYDHKGIRVEIAGFRAHSIEEDLKMRDLTVNSIAYAVRDGVMDTVPLDPTGGINDIRYHILRTYREKNIIDDPLRILRIFRFSSSLGYEIDLNTIRNMTAHRELLLNMPAERINGEFSEILTGRKCVEVLRLMAYSGILGTLIPELKSVEDFLHIDRYHRCEGVFEHSLRVLGNCENDLEMKLAALFHDIGKPVTAGRIKTGSYIGHEITGASMTCEILTRMKYPARTVHAVCEIVANHMLNYTGEKAVRKFAFSSEEAIYTKTMKFIEADKLATNTEWRKSPEYREYSLNFDLKFRESVLLERIAKSIDGYFLLSIGIKPGPWMKKIIGYVHNFFLEKTSRIDDFNVKILLEKELLFEGAYADFKFGRNTCKRKREYYHDGCVYGILENGKRLDIKTGIFEFHYLEEEDLNLWLKQNSEYSSFFSS